jgi:hypothetical protein
VANVGLEPPKILKRIVDPAAEADAASVGKGERQLKLAKEASGARKGQGHGAEFAQQAMPFLYGGTALGQGEVPQDLLKALPPMGREFEGHRGGVNGPAKEMFVGFPVGVAFK